ncbi:MAG TPA: phosphoribosylamine--glycine ligase [Candidatus Dormibacteraeota bacterium]|nr:phosphoribosylamine--glycine ligase [Candidatus Dormibacteraeota bacterium]
MIPAPDHRTLQVLVVGGGGREHALAWACGRSPLVERVICSPGNAGTLLIGENRAVAATDAPALVALARAEGVDLVVLGPDAAVAAGVGDAAEAAGIRCFGPGREAGQLESSKIFAKQVMRRASVTTPAFAAFADPELALAHVHQRGAPVVVKADGLALGKGAFVCRTEEEAREAVELLLLRRELGAAGARVLIEDCLEGEEASFFAICDGVSAVMLPPARDYKRAFDHDQGGNTGGMGSYAPAPDQGWRALNQRVRKEVVEPTLREMARRGTPYRGCLYVGAMLVDGAIQVLEFNARLGDPETEVQLPLLPDPVPLMWQSAGGQLSASDPEPRAGACVGVVAVREPYPAAVTAGGQVSGIDAAEEMGCLVFQMGTRPGPGGSVEVAGGRVLICTAVGKDVTSARLGAYSGLAAISFPGMRYRQDIGA